MASKKKSTTKKTTAKKATTAKSTVKKSSKVKVSSTKKQKVKSLSSKQSGIDTKVAKTAYKKVNTQLTSLSTHIKSLQNHVEEMNKKTWYGGQTANQWYAAVNTTNKNLVTFYNGVSTLQGELRAKFEQAKILLGIDF